MGGINACSSGGGGGGGGGRGGNHRTKSLCLLVPKNGVKPRKNIFPAVQKQYKKVGILRK
jgi:hypothetical protein